MLNLIPEARFEVFQRRWKFELGAPRPTDGNRESRCRRAVYRPLIVSEGNGGGEEPHSVSSRPENDLPSCMKRREADIDPECGKLLIKPLTAQDHPTTSNDRSDPPTERRTQSL